MCARTHSPSFSATQSSFSLRCFLVHFPLFRRQNRLSPRPRKAQVFHSRAHTLAHTFRDTCNLNTCWRESCEIESERGCNRVHMIQSHRFERARREDLICETFFRRRPRSVCSSSVKEERRWALLPSTIHTFHTRG